MILAYLKKLFLFHLFISFKQVKDDDAQSNCSTQSRQSSRSSRSRSSKELQPEPLDNNMDFADDDGEPLPPLQMLAKAARILNPKQFELPKEMECNTPIPGMKICLHYIKELICKFMIERKSSNGCLM